MPKCQNARKAQIQKMQKCQHDQMPKRQNVIIPTCRNTEMTECQNPYPEDGTLRSVRALASGGAHTGAFFEHMFGKRDSFICHFRTAAAHLVPNLLFRSSFPILCFFQLLGKLRLNYAILVPFNLQKLR